MLTLSTRPLSEAERERVSQPDAPLGCFHYFAVYGACLILVPFIGGGFIGAMLKLAGVPENWAFGIGLAVAAPCGLVMAGKITLGILETKRQGREVRKRRLETNQIQILAIEGILRVWNIQADEDLGPAYLIEFERGKFIYVDSQAFLDSWNEDRPDDFPGDNLKLERYAPDRTMVSLKVTGPSRSTEDASLEMDEGSRHLWAETCVLLPDELELPANWLAVVSAG